MIKAAVLDVMGYRTHVCKDVWDAPFRLVQSSYQTLEAQRRRGIALPNSHDEKIGASHDHEYTIA